MVLPIQRGTILANSEGPVLPIRRGNFLPILRGTIFANPEGSCFCQYGGYFFGQNLSGNEKVTRKRYQVIRRQARNQ